MPGRRPVDHDQVVVAAPLELFDLAEHDDVVDARRCRGDHVDHAAAWPAAWRRDRGRGCRGIRRALRWRSVRDSWMSSPTRRGQRRLAVELDDQHTKSPIGCRTRQNRGYRGLPDAPLASHDGNLGGRSGTAADSRSSEALVRRLAITILIAPFRRAGGSVAVVTLALTQRLRSRHRRLPAAMQSMPSQLAPVDVLQVSGIFDKIVVRSIVDAIDRSESNGSQALILQVNSRGAVVSTDEMTALLQRVADAKVPIGIWVGPSRVVARLRLAGAVAGRRRCHRDGRRQPHRLHQHAAHGQRRADQLRRRPPISW